MKGLRSKMKERKFKERDGKSVDPAYDYFLFNLNFRKLKIHKIKNNQTRVLR